MCIIVIRYQINLEWRLKNDQVINFLYDLKWERREQNRQQIKNLKIRAIWPSSKRHVFFTLWKCSTRYSKFAKQKKKTTK